jgi:hypothetical protein
MFSIKRTQCPLFNASINPMITGASAIFCAVYVLNKRRDLSWQTYRFDCWRWHGVENRTLPGWRTSSSSGAPDHRIAAVLHPEGRGEAFLQVHPAWRTPGWKAEMLATGEQQIAQREVNDQRLLTVWANEDDADGTICCSSVATLR